MSGLHHNAAPLFCVFMCDEFMTISFSQRVVCWQQQAGRHHLPWQCCDPYRVWLSEIMLQQTQVATVLQYYPRFVAHFPTVADLAAAETDEVFALWSGLGYYSRARNLHCAASQVMTHFAGKMPKHRQALESLKGIGRSTAAAICVFAYGQKEAILDGNVKRVLARHAGIFGIPDQAKTQQAFWSEAEKRLPDGSNNLRRYTQGLMDLGSIICTRRKPRCGECPVAEDCFARTTNKIGQLPEKKPRRVKPEKQTVFLMLYSQHGVMLCRRPDSGIWRNLWSFPEFDNVTEALELAGKHGNILQQTTLKIRKHAFTHYLLHITPLQVQINAIDRNSANWLSLQEALEKGLPAPVRTLLEEMQAVESPIQLSLNI